MDLHMNNKCVRFTYTEVIIIDIADDDREVARVDYTKMSAAELVTWLGGEYAKG